MQQMISISRLHSSRILCMSHGRLKKPRFPTANANASSSIQELEKMMHSQVDILDGKISEESDMMKNVLQLHASQSETSKQSSKKARDQDWYLETAHNIPSKWENFVPKWQRSAEKLPKKVFKEDDPVLAIAAIVEEINKENGVNTVVMDMTAKCDYTDAFIFTQGNNTRHVSAIAQAVKMLAKSKITSDPSLPKSIKMTDAKGQDWVIVDMGKYIMHVFTQNAREYYDLESLWAFVIDPMNLKTQNDRAAYSSTQTDDIETESQYAKN